VTWRGAEARALLRGGAVKIGLAALGRGNVGGARIACPEGIPESPGAVRYRTLKTLCTDAVLANPNPKPRGSAL
jgi:hypothetical protein